ncbi:MAG: RHS repeat-associated core domain-containing protein, partial [Clostridia bacterium]|nr:RHS repeat-associated core domain-containing protein [Clostridia bacterium]
RGYYYDTETNLYYLKTRYYDSSVGRFISPDSVDFITADKINGLNLYAYCANNPIMNVDPTGKFLIALILGIGAIIGGIIGGIVSYNKSKEKDNDEGKLLGDTLKGVAFGASIGVA